MFLGHFGVGFGAKHFAPGISLGFLFIAAQFLDLLWPTLLLLDVEHVAIVPGITRMTPMDFYDYPISHSLLAVVGWGILLGLLTRLLTKNNHYAFVVLLCVVSHWFLDLLVHRPDLPLAPATEARWGLGLWNHPFATVLAEALFFFGGIYLYVRSTTAKNKVGKFALIGLIVFFVLIEIGNFTGPPPPDVASIAWVSQAQWLFVLLAFWIDRNRMNNPT